MPGMGREGTKMQKKNYQEEILNLIHSAFRSRNWLSVCPITTRTTLPMRWRP